MSSLHDDPNAATDTLLVGIDAGGTVTKAAVFDRAGRQLTLATERVAADTPHPRWTERDMDGAWHACARAIRRVLAAPELGPDPGARVVGVGFAAHNDGVYLVDGAGRPVRPAILASDGRAAAIVDRWRADGTLDRALALTGQEPGPGAPAALLAWLREHEADTLARASAVLCCKDWLRLELTGELATDPTDAATLFTEVHSRAYSDDALGLFGLGELRRLLPPLVGSAEVAGAVTAAAAEVTGLRVGTPVVTGAHDVDAGAIGVGATATGRLSIMAGTWAINQLPTDRVVLDPRWEARAFVEDGRWLHMGTSPASAASLEWTMARMGLGTDADAFTQVNADVASVLDEPAGPVFHPFLLGSGADDGASGALLGLRAGHSRAHILRAVFEGVVCNHRVHVEALREAFSIAGAARLTGGGARSALWCQMFADALRVEIEVPDTEEAGARGAAVLAGLGVGLWSSLDEATTATVRIDGRFSPDEGRAERFDATFARYTATLEALAPAWAVLG